MMKISLPKRLQPFGVARTVVQERGGVCITGEFEFSRVLTGFMGSRGSHARSDVCGTLECGVPRQTTHSR